MMDVNPYESPREASDTFPRQKPSRGWLFIVLGMATLVSLILPLVGVLFIETNAVLWLAALLPVGLLGVLTILHGIKSSPTIIRLIVFTLGLLAGEFVVLAIVGAIIGR